MTVLLKLVALFAVVGVFVAFVPGVSFGAWDDFVTATSADPWQGAPNWPSFGEPGGNRSAPGGFYLTATSAEIAVPQCWDPSMLLMENDPGAAPHETELLSSSFASCWINSAAPGTTVIAGDWRVVANGTAGAGTNTTVRVELWKYYDDIWGTYHLGLICSWTTVVSASTWTFDEQCPQGQISFLNGWWYNEFWAAEFIVLSGTRPVSVRMHGGMASDSRVLTPDIVAIESQCAWNDVGSWGDCVADATAFVGGSLLYLGGLVWTLLNYIGLALWWFANLIWSLLSLTFDAATLNVVDDGSGQSIWPADVRTFLYLFSVTFWAVVVLTLINIVRGRG